MSVRDAADSSLLFTDALRIYFGFFFFFFVSIFLGDSLKETLAANVDREICVAVEFYQDENDNVLFCFCHYCWTRLILDPSFVLCN